MRLPLPACMRACGYIIDIGPRVSSACVQTITVYTLQYAHMHV